LNQKSDIYIDQTLTKPPSDQDLTKLALNQSSTLVKKLLQQCVFKNSGKQEFGNLSPRSKTAAQLSKTTQNKMSQKSGMTNHKRSKIERLVERDIRQGQKFKREEIEEMMKDQNFSNMYADVERYEKIEDPKTLRLIKKHLEDF